VGDCAGKFVKGRRVKRVSTEKKNQWGGMRKLRVSTNEVLWGGKTRGKRFGKSYGSGKGRVESKKRGWAGSRLVDTR